MTGNVAANLSAQLNAEKVSNHPTPEVRWNGTLPDMPVAAPTRRQWDGKERRSKNNRHWMITLLAVAWSLIVTAGAGIAVARMNDRLEDSCEARQKARTAIRVSFAADPDWTPADQAVLDLDLPEKVIC